MTLIGVERTLCGGHFVANFREMIREDVAEVEDANTNSWGFQQLTAGCHARVETTCRKSGTRRSPLNSNHEEKDSV